MLFSLGGGLNLDLFTGSPLRRLDNARRVRTLPALMQRCSLKTFVEFWTVLSARQQRKMNEEAASGAAAASASAQVVEESDEENKQQSQKKKKRRSGEQVIGNIPWPILVHICGFLKHNAVANFSFSNPHNDLQYLTLVEDMQFCIDRVVSFELRLTINGQLVPGSKLWLQPNMTVLCDFGISAEERDGEFGPLLSPEASRQRRQQGLRGMMDRTLSQEQEEADREERDKRRLERRFLEKWPLGIVNGVVLFDHGMDRFRSSFTPGLGYGQWADDGKRVF